MFVIMKAFPHYDCSPSPPAERMGEKKKYAVLWGLIKTERYGLVVRKADEHRY